MLALEMRLRIGPGGDDRTLVLEGELDVASADHVVSAIGLCSVPEGDLVLDCRKLSFIDGAGVRALVSVAERLPEGTRLVLDRPAGLALRVLQMLRVEENPRVAVRHASSSA